jgi:hypothetical protein
MVKIPDNTATAQLMLIDGVRNKGFPIPDIYKSGNWEFVAVSIRADTAATGLTFRFSCTEGTSGSIRVANACMTLGQIARHHVSDWAKGGQQHFTRQKTKAVVNLTTSGQIDPSLCGIHKIQGSGGAVTITSGQAFFSASGNWKPGQQVMLVGQHNTNTVTFISGSGSNLRLGAATRTLSQDGTLTLFWDSGANRWIEVSYSPGGF